MLTPFFLMAPMPFIVSLGVLLGRLKRPEGGGSFFLGSDALSSGTLESSLAGFSSLAVSLGRGSLLGTAANGAVGARVGFGVSVVSASLGFASSGASRSKGGRDESERPRVFLAFSVLFFFTQVVKRNSLVRLRLFVPLWFLYSGTVQSMSHSGWSSIVLGSRVSAQAREILQS